MNIFYLHEDPWAAAEMMHDKHVVKMVLETAQILSTVVDALKPGVLGLYRPTHASHPCVLWTMRRSSNFSWLVLHGQALAAEYTYRFGKIHKSAEVIELAANLIPVKFDGMTEIEQCMPDEFKITGDPVGAYRQYYLGRKVEQSRWTRRPVPEFVKEFEMSKNKQVKHAASETAQADAPAHVEAAAKASPVGVRGPKGMELNAKITIKADKNPKRPGSKAFDVFAKYVDGMSVQQFMEAAAAEATPNLVYDAAHGFISVEGHTPAKVYIPKVKAEKPVKEPKAKKEKPAKTSEEAEVEQAAVEETVD